MFIPSLSLSLLSKVFCFFFFRSNGSFKIFSLSVDSTSTRLCQALLKLPKMQSANKYILCKITNKLTINKDYVIIIVELKYE